MTNIKRNVSWINIIKFHKEIAIRAEESFFSLPINNMETDRWSSINKFSIEGFDGPWQVGKENIVNSSFIRTIRIYELKI